MMRRDHAGQATGFPSHSRITVNVRGRPVTVATSSSNRDAEDLVLLLHGLGSGRTMFSAVHTGTDQRHWLAIDCPGHGESPPVGTGGDLLGLYADLVIELVTQLTPRRVHLVGHAMGAAVALIAAPALEVGALIAIEGTLTEPDCGPVIRHIAAEPRESFIHTGFIQLRDELLGAAEAETRIWGNRIEQADPATVWDAAASLVTWCDSDGLAARWPRQATYLWGEDAGYPEHLRAVLAGSRVRSIPGTAHWPMIDNPLGLAAAVTSAIDHADNQPETGDTA